MIRALGYEGYEPFGRGVLLFPKQPRPAYLACNTDRTIGIVQAYIKSCHEHHSCESGGFTPRRLLNLGSGKISDPSALTDPIRLVEPPTNFSPHFVALSHCWGKTQQAVTTKNNYHERLASISLQELSKTFQDAVWITRRLGIRFLWIDSLCIVQDDADDWEREAVDMGRIYAAAYLTVAASHGADGTAGIFYESPRESPAHHRVMDLKLSPPGKTEPSTVTVALMPEIHPQKESHVHQLYGDTEMSVDNSSTEALLGRGWAFQERLLSARIVHFTREELVWECRDSRGCECGVIRGSIITNMFMGSLRSKPESHSNQQLRWEEDDDEHTNSSTDGESATDSDSRSDRPFNTFDEYSSRSAWCRLVELYTTRQFTKLSDRGPAFAGIAQSFSRSLVGTDDKPLGEYCAGLWGSHLAQSLLWSCSTDNIIREPDWTSPNTGRRIMGAMAPSWSWYSVSGPCRFLDGRAAPLNLRARYHEYDYEPRPLGLTLDGDPLEEVAATYEFDAVTGSQFGRLRRAAVTLEYVAIAVASRTDASGVFKLKPQAAGTTLHGAISITLLADDPNDARMVGDITCLHLYMGKHDIHVDKRDQFEPDMEIEELDNDNYHLYFTVYECDKHSVGLALVPVPGEDGTYRRIGLFHAKCFTCMGYSNEDTRPLIRASDVIPPNHHFYVDWKSSFEFRKYVTLI
ncbi:heterokaryon incompatibility protein-domain-containing protein [Bombardia bombarda]|uniref:Heterokaryon incompatibility protein-domain-containing protein n=1 Tax=Bombardia bombarda TaxID=252184 RepID=A0AA39WU74_9PEZI|nr:heterokaryon incompatibility protein-domain-containing protein [Bombardia bombarda]